MSARTRARDTRPRRVEGDRYDPSLELVFRLAVFFEVPVEDLFDPEVDVERTVSDH